MVNISCIGKQDDTYGKYGHGTGSWYTYNDDGSLKRYADFSFVTASNGTLHKLLDPFWGRADLIPESCTLAGLSGTDIEGFITKIEVCNDESKNTYYEYFGKKYIKTMHGTDSNDVGPFTYVEDFEDGGMLCTNIPGAGKNGVGGFSVATADWAEFGGFAPVFNPLYIKDFPMPMHWKACGALSISMLGVKYIYTSIMRPMMPSFAGTYTIPYEVREDGVLRKFSTIDHPIQSSESARKYFTYYYDDDPEDKWNTTVIAGSEDMISLMK